MSNVILGMIGVILFIGMALAGATYFGPRLNQSVNQGAAATVVSELVAISAGVQSRNSALETQTGSAGNANFLLPDYMDDAPKNPTFGKGPMLVNAAGDMSGNASYVIMEVIGGDVGALCLEINRLGRGGVVPTRSGPPTGQVLGSFWTNRNLTGNISSGSCVAYAIIS